MTHRSFLPLAALIVLSITQLGAGCGRPGPVPGEAVVFDIDGTLSNDPLDLITVRDGAVEAIEAYLDLGYEVILLTARADELELFTRAWLLANGFPELPLYMADGLLLFDFQRVAFKRDTLLDLEETLDLDFVYAYGDTSTDFEAYAQAGIASTETFALLAHFASDCEPGDWAECLPDYVDHLDYIDVQPPAQ